MRGLKCPLPALKTRKLLSGMAAGELLVIECTDPLAAIDIPNLIRETGDTIEAQRQEGPRADVPDQEGLTAVIIPFDQPDADRAPASSARSRRR